MTPEDMPQMNRRDLLKWMAIGAGFSVVPLATASVETGFVSVERHRLNLPQWDAHGFKVAVLADLHTNTPGEVEHAKHAFRLAMAEKPDLIAIPGDFANYGDDERLQYIAQSLEPLHDAKCPVFATLGNHDYSGGNILGVIDTLRASPAELLINQSRDVHGVTTYGFDDAVSITHKPDAFTNGNYSRSLLSLLHEPDLADAMPRDISLQVSGHSHGGQICLPGGRPLHTPIGANKYWAGYYPHAKVPLYVTRGVGTVGPRLRLFCRPEVTILTLYGA